MLEKVGTWNSMLGEHCVGVKIEGRDPIFKTNDKNLAELVQDIINKYADVMRGRDVWGEYETVDMYTLCKLTPRGDNQAIWDTVITYIIDTPSRIRNGAVLNLVRVKHFEYATALCTALKNYISTQNTNLKKAKSEVKPEDTVEYWRNKYEDLVQALQNMY